jgi:hypothetical protein
VRFADPQREAKRELAERVIRRAAARQEPWTTPLRAHLPHDKAEYPKLLCLDQNKWIDLARSHYGRENGTPFRDALDAVRQGIANGKLVVPVAGANLYEAAEHPDPSRRERLARFMVDLSQNQSLVNHEIVLRWELRRAVLVVFEKRVPRAVRPALLHPGMFVAATGKYPVMATGEPEIDALATAAMYDPDLAVASIVQFMDRQTVCELRDKDKHAAEAVEGIRRLDALAIPYANIVVAEKSWSHVAATSGLGERYGTVIVRDARALPDLLRSEGCLQ